MWPLRWFHYDEEIDSLEVYLRDGPGEAELMSRDGALAIARSRGLHLVPEWPEQQTTGPSSCLIGAVSLPVGWEQVPEAEQAEDPDPLLWFEAPCGGRDLLTGNGGTYPWPHVGLVPGQAGQLQRVPGRDGPDVTAGQVLRGRVPRREPARPAPAAGPRRRYRPRRPDRLEGRCLRFRRTGLWLGRWRTCHTCGSVLLPDTAADNCQEHLQSQSQPS